MASGSVRSLSLSSLLACTTPREAARASARLWVQRHGGRTGEEGELINSAEGERGERRLLTLDAFYATFQARESDTKERWEERDRECW